MIEQFRSRLRDHVSRLIESWKNAGLDANAIPASSDLLDALMSSSLQNLAADSTPLDLHESLSRFLLEQRNPIMLSILTPFISFHRDSPLLTINEWDGSPASLETDCHIIDMFNDPFMRAYRDSQILADDLRRKFHSKEIADIGAWEGCHDLYDSRLDTHRLPYPETVPIYCSPGMSLELPTVAAHEKFLENWRLLTNGVLDGLDWTNVLAAGGAVLACALPGFTPDEYGEDGNRFVSSLNEAVSLQRGHNTEVEPYYVCGLNGFWASDIDLFIHSCSTERAMQVIDSIIATVTANNKSATVMRSAFAITIFGFNPHRDVQIVLRLYSLPCEVIHGFDIDCAGIAFDGSTVYVTTRCLQALRARVNVVNMTYRSTTYSTRLIKYAYRDFAIAVPGYERDMGIPHLLPPKVAFTHDTIWNSSALSKHTRADVEQRYIRCLADIRSSGVTSFLKTKVAPELSAIIAEDLRIAHMECCQHSSASSTAGKDSCPLRIGGFRGRSCQCAVARTPASDLFAFIVAIAMRKDIANVNTKRLLNSERRDFAKGRRLYIRHEDVACELVENAPFEDNSIEAIYRIINKDSRGLDPLSMAYHHQHDYATPSSTGFHSKATLQWADKNPRCMNGILIGPLDYVLKAAPMTLLTDNPGRQGLLTSSFHPLLSNGFYGDMRWFVGPRTYIDLPTCAHSDTAWLSKDSGLANLLFYVNHFYSHPSYLAKILEASQEERTCRELANTALNCFSLAFTSFAALHKMLMEGRRAAERGLLACEESVKQLSHLEAASRSYIGSRCVRNGFELTIAEICDLVSSPELTARSQSDSLFGTQYTIFRTIMQFFEGITSRRQSLVDWKRDHDVLEDLLLKFERFIDEVRVALLQGKPFKSELFQIDSSLTFTSDWLSTRQRLAAAFCRRMSDSSFISMQINFPSPSAFNSLSALKELPANADLDSHEMLLKASDAPMHRYVYGLPTIEQVAQVDNLFALVYTDKNSAFKDRLAGLRRHLSQFVSMAPDFTSCYAEVSVCGEPLLDVMSEAYSAEEVLYLLKNLVSVLRASPTAVLDPLLRNAYVVDRSHIIVVSAPLDSSDRYAMNLLRCLQAVRGVMLAVITPNHPAFKALQDALVEDAPPDMLDSLTDALIFSANFPLDSVFEPIALPRCDVINLIYRNVRKASGSTPIVHMFNGNLTALNLLSVFKSDASFTSLATRCYSFATGTGAIDDVEYCRLLLAACKAEGALVYDEETRRYTLPKKTISTSVAETLRRLGRLLSWAFLHQRRLPLHLSNLVIAVLKFGSVYSYTEDTLHTVLVDADNSKSASTLLENFADAPKMHVTSFTSISTGIKYIFSEDAEALTNNAMPTIAVSSVRRFGALYCTNEYIHSRSMAIRALLEDWNTIGVLKKVEELTGVKIEAALNVKQLRSLLMDDDQATP